jgi:hypothetical protein
MSTPMITIKIEAIEFINKGIEEDLRNFVEREILSTETDRNRLEKIIIRELGDYSDTYGYWEPASILEKKHQLHPALKKSFSSLYGYTSDEQGIRHAMSKEPNLTADDAKFFLLSCTSFINYLKAKMS